MLSTLNSFTEAQLAFTPTQGQWVTISIPLADFTSAGMSAFSDINQLIFSALPTGGNTVYLDNIYFSGDCNASTPTAPTVAATAPDCPAGSVISMFSEAYTDVTVDTWRTDWSSATFVDTTIAGNAVKKYSA